MHAITHIIATTDFSAAAERAVQRAALIAKQLNAELHLMHVVHPLDLYTSTELSFGYQKHFGHMLQELSKDQLNTLAAKLQKDFDISAQIATRIGLAHTEITSYAASKANCLIVAGAHGESENTLLNLLLGSTATRPLRAATCPQRQVNVNSLGAVPLGVPLITGPAVPTTSMPLLNQYGAAWTAVAIIANTLIASTVFFFASTIGRVLGQVSEKIISKIAMLLLAAIGVMMVRKGVEAFIAVGITSTS